MVPEIWNTTEPFLILDYFLPIYPPNNLENLTFEKMKKKTPGDIIILHKYTINNNHDVWFLRYEVEQTKVFVILGQFCPFTPLTNQKIKVLKKWKMKMKISWRYYFT